jgi:prevent-host-death family protein
MEQTTVSVRDLRLNFAEVQRKVAEYGEIVITKNGVASYLLKAVPATKKKRAPLPDYWARLSKRKGLTVEQTRSLHEENRGDH